jgi:uncharacterized protein YeeX (DUF496 family)
MASHGLVVKALEDIIKAIKNDYHQTTLDIAVDDAIYVLGYDPSNMEVEYLVALEIGVPAKNPEEAVQKFIQLLKNNTTYEWCYKVTNDEDDVEEIVDTYRWGNADTERFNK